jgi:putative cardiolipin synthase
MRIIETWQPLGRRSRCRRGWAWLLAALALLAVSGCASLAPGLQGPPSAARPASPATALGQLAAAALPDPDLSGFRLMPEGRSAFDTRIQLARRAQDTLDLQYYQIHNDETGRYLLRTLRDAAQRGVRVRVLMDDMYTAGDDELLSAFAAHPNVELRLYNPFVAGRGQVLTRFLYALADFDRVNRRMHNKLFIADGAMAVAGGRNIGNEYFGRNTSANFIDLDSFVTGAIVPRLQSLFDRFWNSPYVLPYQAIVADALPPAHWQQRFDELTAEATTPPPEPPPPNDVLGYGPMADDLAAGKLNLVWAPATAYADSPERAVGKTASYGGVALLDVESVRYNVVESLRRARTEVALASPYLIPGPAGLEVMNEARRRGAKVSLLTNSLAATDEPLVHSAYRRYRDDMLRVGVELNELSSNRARRSARLGVFGATIGRLHMKTAVYDRRLLFVGSMNFDPRSSVHNTEIGLFIDSPELAQQVLKLIDTLKSQGAYTLRLAPDGKNLAWISKEAGGEVVLHEEPDATLWDRVLLNLLAPLVPESLL